MEKHLLSMFSLSVSLNEHEIRRFEKKGLMGVSGHSRVAVDDQECLTPRAERASDQVKANFPG